MTTLEKLAAYTGERGISLLAGCVELGLTQQLSGRALSRVQEFGQWVVDFADRAKRGDPVALFKDLLNDIGELCRAHQLFLMR